jgi:hypothetical protein
MTDHEATTITEQMQRVRTLAAQLREERAKLEQLLAEACTRSQWPQPRA